MHRKTAYKRWCVEKVETCSQCRSVLGMASYSWLNGPAVVPSCTNLNLDDISCTVSSLTLRLLSWASWLGKAIPFSSRVWGVAYSLVLRSAVLKDEKYIMINMQSHEFSYYLGIIALTTGIKCTRYRSCNYFARCSFNYSQIALESMWLPIQIKLFLGPNSEAIQYKTLKLYCGIIPTDTMCKQGFIQIKSVFCIQSFESDVE